MLRTLLEQRAPLYAEVATLVVPPAARTPGTSSPTCSPRCPPEPGGGSADEAW
jgi:hypothetical protein